MFRVLYAKLRASPPDGPTTCWGKELCVEAHILTVMGGAAGTKHKMQWGQKRGCGLWGPPVQTVPEKVVFAEERLEFTLLLNFLRWRLIKVYDIVHLLF